MVQQSLFDALDTHADVVGAPTARRRATLAPGERAAWDAWKARLLPGFVAPSSRALAASRLHRSGWWVDGLAFVGRSPTGAAANAFAETADVLAASGFVLHGARLQPGRPAHTISADAGAPLAEPISAQQSGGQRNGRKAREQPQSPDAEALASMAREDLLATLGEAPAAILIDPFAAPPLMAEELLPLCQRQASTELLLAISSARLEQVAMQGLAGQPAPDASSQNQQVALTALLRSDAWKAIWSGPGKSAEKITRTLELLRGLLKPHFLFVCLAALDEWPMPAPRRYLLFASRQYPSVALLNDFLCAEQARLAREREARALQGGWFARRRETARAAAWTALKEELHTLGRLRRARLWPDLKPLVVLAHFGHFSAADHDAALLELLREGRVACRWSPAASTAPEAPGNSPPAERVPGPQDFLEFLEARTRPVWRR